jgi:WD40 repeat protein
VQVWDAIRGEPLAALLPASGPVLGITFRADGRLLATIHAAREGANDKDGVAIRVWDTATWQPVTPLLPHAKVTSVAFTPDGRGVISTGADDTARIWDLRPTERPTADLLEQAELLAGRRLHANGYLTPLEETVLRETWPKLRKYRADPQ